MRTAEIVRKTKETEIHLRLNLDGKGIYQVKTGVGFFDHMLSHVALHGLFDINLEASGDLDVDEHHLIEDCALVLGQAFDQALGERQGITRMGSAYVPMDESLAFVCIDLSGRPYTVFQAEWHSPAVGGIAASLFAHFFESFAVSARCNLHARVLYGRDDHHQVEALFKALGRALDTACRLDPRRNRVVPSTKGTLV
jgi:imidazoleglycerol-phosphate dehydratase